MKETNKKIRVTASDLVQFMKCEHIFTLNRTLSSDLAVEAAEDKALFLEKGNQHEYTFKSSLKELVEIDEDQPEELRMQASVQAMREGAKYIYHPVLFSDEGCYGEIDFLERVDGKPSNLGKYSYRVLDTKFSTKNKPEYVIQLCHYSDLLSYVQNVPPDTAEIVGMRGKGFTYKISDFIDFYRHTLSRFLEFKKNKPVTQPYLIDFCGFCKWREHCENEVVQKKHLSLLSGIKKSQVDALLSEGIETIPELASLNLNTWKRKRGVTVSGLEKLKRTAEAVKSGKYKIHDPAPLKNLPKLDESVIFLDLESDPFFDDEGHLQYLFGLIEADKKNHLTFKSWFALNRAEEKEAFEQVVGLISKKMKKFGSVRIVHYGNYEKSWLPKLATRHSICEEDVDEFLRQEVFIDLYRIITRSMSVPTRSTSLKDVEALYSFQRSGDVQSGGSSIVRFDEWKTSKDPKKLKIIEDYNRQDIESTVKCFKWLKGLA